MAELDVETILGLLAAVNIFLSLVMVVYWRLQRVYPGFGLWTLCNVCVALMWILFFLRRQLPDAALIIIPNTLAAIAAMLRLEGLRRFLGRPHFDMRSTLIPVVVLALFVIFTFVHDDVYIRTAIIMFTVALVVWSMAWLVVSRATGRDKMTYLWSGALWSIYGAGSLARGVFWLVHQTGNPLLEPIGFNEYYFLASVLLDIAWTVVFITMNHQRTTADLETAHQVAESTRDRLADIIAFLPDATFAVDAERRVIAWNRAAERLFGLRGADVLGKPYREAVFPALGDDTRVLLDTIFDPQLPPPSQYAALTRVGENVSAEASPTEIHGRAVDVWVTAGPLRDSSGALVGAIESVRDIGDIKNAERERARLQERLLHARRLESLGIMAGGISHDFNNLHAIIQGNLHLAMQGAAPGSPCSEYVTQALHASERAAALTAQIRDYAGGSFFTIAPVDLAALVERSRVELREMVDKRIALEFRLAGTATIRGDDEALRQVLQALVLNGAESIEAGRGTVTVVTGTRSCDQAYLSRNRLDNTPLPGIYAFLEVSDTGVGMEDETITRTFDPFFTTKFPGRGLGLSAASGIIAAHDGAITVSSEPTKGTTFSVLLPGVDRGEAPTATPTR